MTGQVRVGVAVIVEREGKILLALRKSAHGENTWGFPGGHLEHGESPEDCARREMREETGLELESVSRHAFTSDVFRESGKHYITIFTKGRIAPGAIPRVTEPDKCVRWEWFAPDNLPQPLFLPIINLMQDGYALTG